MYPRYSHSVAAVSLFATLTHRPALRSLVRMLVNEECTGVILSSHPSLWRDAVSAIVRVKSFCVDFLEEGYIN